MLKPVEGVHVYVCRSESLWIYKIEVLDTLHEAVEYRVGYHIWDLRKAENINLGERMRKEKEEGSSSW